MEAKSEYANLTNQELHRRAKNYDNVMNEGGEGYNPFWEELERRADQKERELSAKLAATPQGRIEALYKRVEAECGSIARESSPDGSAIDKLQNQLYAEIHEIQAEMKTAFETEWTLEITKARRIEWNTFAEATLCPLLRAKKGMEMAKRMRDRQERQGWTMHQLKTAIERHNL